MQGNQHKLAMEVEGFTTHTSGRVPKSGTLGRPQERREAVMMRQRLLMAISVVALIGAGCAKPYNPFVISRDQIYSKVETIAVAPVAVPEDLEVPEPVKAKFASTIEAKLREAGFLVVPSGEYAKIWEGIAEQVGAFFDPVTGKRDESKFKALRKNCLRELLTKYNANAVVYPEIRAVTANFSSYTAWWHGTRESVKVPNEGILAALTRGNYYGTLAALSLVVTIKDMDEVEMYVNPGGIQVLARVSSRGKFVPVPPNELLVNEERNGAAVDIAMEPLITKPEKP